MSESPVGLDGYPVSANTKSNKKETPNDILARNKLILEKLANQEKDDDEIMSEHLEKQIKETIPKEMSTKILDIARCPCCKEFYFGYVMQCDEGHQLCEDCRDKVNICPECRKPFGMNKIRSRAVETVLTQLEITVPCAHRSMGCEEQIPYANIHEHRRKCKYKPAECFYGSCGFKAKNYGDYVNHLASRHKSIPTDLPQSELFQISISNIMSYLSGHLVTDRSVVFIHPYKDDYLIILIRPFNGSRSDYRMSVHSLGSKNYIFSTTIQATNVAFTSQSEFSVLSINLLQELYAKVNSPKLFYEFYTKKFDWFTAKLDYKQLEELSHYPSATINCMIREPSQSEANYLKELENSHTYKLLPDPVENILTQNQIDGILGQENNQYLEHPIDQLLNDDDDDEDVEEEEPFLE